VGKTSGLGISNTHNFGQFADKALNEGYKHPVGQGGGDFGTLHLRSNFYGQGI